VYDDVREEKGNVNNLLKDKSKQETDESKKHFSISGSFIDEKCLRLSKEKDETSILFLKV
jgi:hypothetical protein